MRKRSWTLSVRNWKTSFLNLNIHIVNDFTDFDECSLDPSPCDENSDCSNSEGSYSCTCKTGFTGNGAICEGVRYNKTIHFAFILWHKMRRCYFFSIVSRIAEGFFHRSSTIKIQALFIWICAVCLDVTGMQRFFNEHSQLKQNTALSWIKRHFLWCKYGRTSLQRPLWWQSLLVL